VGEGPARAFSDRPIGIPAGLRRVEARPAMLEQLPRPRPGLAQSGVCSVPGEEAALVFGVPYDGRSRTAAPATPLLALIWRRRPKPVVLHGGDPIRVKYGQSPSPKLFAALGGIEWRNPQALPRCRPRLETPNLASPHQPCTSPPPIALLAGARTAIGPNARPGGPSLELSSGLPSGEQPAVSGLRSPPHREPGLGGLAMAGEPDLLTRQKGWKGSTDLATFPGGHHRLGLRDGVIDPKPPCSIPATMGIKQP